MTDLMTFFQYGIPAALVLLTLATARDYLRSPDARRACLLAAIGLLAIVAVIGRVNVITGERYVALGYVSIPAFMASGYVLLVFRHLFLPLRRWVLVASGAAVAALTAVTMPAAVGIRADSILSLRERALIVPLIAAWCACVAEPVVRFWWASRGRPAVQRARMRTLSLGYLGLIAVLVVAGIAVGAGETQLSAGLGVALNATALAMVPLLYAGFVAPRWLRRIWREPEDEAFRQGLEQLLTHARTSTELAHSALGWALRLVGAGAGIIVSEQDGILAQQGVDRQQRDRVLRAAREHPETMTGSDDLLVVDLPDHAGRIVVVADPFTPLFGSDEVVALQRYAAAIAVALERTRLLEQLEASRAEVAASHAELEEFLRAVSHDLRTPVLSIQGYLKYLEEDAGDSLGADARNYVTRMRAACSHMGSLIADLLELSRVGRLEREEVWEDVGAVAAEVAAELQPLAEQAGAVITIEPGLPEIQVRAGRLRQVVQNLLSNALMYGSVRPLHVRIGSERRPDGWVLWVRDDGVGVAPHLSERIFRSFERLDPKAGDGTGIGLAIVRKILQTHGGDVWLEPVEQGACFAFRFPRTREVVLREPTTAHTAG